jgi:hypothetical protein
VVGWRLDRFFGRRVALVINLITALGIFLLVRASSFSAGCLAAALIGVGAGGEAAITPYLLTRYFGLRAFSTFYGLTWTFYAAAGAIGPAILGRAFDVTGSYASLLTLLAAARGLASSLFRFFRGRDSISEDSTPKWARRELKETIAALSLEVSEPVRPKAGNAIDIDTQGVNFPVPR